ncbi:MAG: hypothetical protein ACC628_13905 [Pirellulaceae bacterium]
MSDPWWTGVIGSQLAQGDLLPDCHLPVFVNPTPTDDESPRDVEVKKQRLIVVTQSCDLENNKVEFVALCPIHTLREFSEVNQHFSTRKNWEHVRRGNQHSLHMLASHDDPANNDKSLVVDFGHIVSLPIGYLADHAEYLGGRWRLSSPYLEHFSQAFARFFMRVGLPSGIPSFK